MGNHHTIFIDACPVCNGDGGGEALPDWPWDFRWIQCRVCGGTGEVETEFECRTLDDLEAEDLEARKS